MEPCRMSELSNTWVLWYHDPNDTNYSLESYTKILTIKTANDFWDIFEVIQKEKWTTGMFFLMKDGYRPLWDAPEHKKGGAWSKKVDGSETYDVFLDCMVHVLAGQLLKKHNEYVVGVSISPKNHFHIIKFWNTSTIIEDWKLFSPTLKMKVSGDIAYKPHVSRK